MFSTEVPVCLAIAGSDSGGGAGVQADLKTFSRFGVFGTTVITSITSQNPAEITSIFPLPIHEVTNQYQAVTNRISVSAIKIGMMATLEIVSVLEKELSRRTQAIPIVVDPVLIASSGRHLISCNPESFSDLFSASTLITPNFDEAQFFSQKTFLEENQATEMAIHLSQKYSTNVLITGGDADTGVARDIFSTDNCVYEFLSDKVNVPMSHGSGCMFSSAITANLALGTPLLEAIIIAKAYIYWGLKWYRKIGERMYAIGCLPKDKIDISVVKVNKMN